MHQYYQCTQCKGARIAEKTITSRYILTFANAAASIVTTRKGALRVMPQKDEVLAFLKADQ